MNIFKLVPHCSMYISNENDLTCFNCTSETTPHKTPVFFSDFSVTEQFFSMTAKINQILFSVIKNI